MTKADPTKKGDGPLTVSDYYSILQERYAQVDWTDLESIREYNRFKNSLRNIMESGAPVSLTTLVV